MTVPEILPSTKPEKSVKSRELNFEGKLIEFAVDSGKIFSQMECVWLFEH